MQWPGRRSSVADMSTRVPTEATSTANVPATTTRQPRLGRTARQCWLVLHIACGVGWMGADVLLAGLVLTGKLSDDGTAVAAAYTIVRLLVPWTVPFLACGMLVTGVVLGWGTRWGLVQWWWVLVKLSVGVVLTVLVFVALVPGALGVPDGLTGSADHVRELVGRADDDLIYPPLVSFTALAFALTLSVFKPWGRTRWARDPRASGER